MSIRRSLPRVIVLAGGFFGPFWLGLAHAEHLPAWVIVMPWPVVGGIGWALVLIGLDLVVCHARRSKPAPPPPAAWRSVHQRWPA